MGRGCGWSGRSRSWGIIVTPAVSVSFFRPEFDDFLYASIGADINEMPLSVLSALARLDVDPWEEAAELSELPKNTATQRLASLIAQLPGGRWAQVDSSAIAVRLIELLPRRSRSKVPSAAKTHGFLEMSGSAKMLICAALVATALIIAASREPSPGDHADAPAFNAASPPQTPRPSSR
jgi:hypothetical protein